MDPRPFATTLQVVDYLNVGVVDYVNATPISRWIT